MAEQKTKSKASGKKKGVQPPDFAEYARTARLTPTYFPYAEKGPRQLSHVITALTYTLVLTVCYLIANYFAPESTSAVKMPDPNVEGSTSIERAANNAPEVAKSFLSNASYYLVEAFKVGAFVALAVFVVLFILYGINNIRRNKAFERNVVKNDYIALSLRKKILKSYRIDAQLKERQREAKKRATRGSGRGSGFDDAIDRVFASKDDMSIRDKEAIEVLKAFKKMTVNVNARQSLSGTNVTRMYVITFRSAASRSVTEELEKLVKEIDIDATRATKGEVSFGSMVVSPARDKFTFTGSVNVDDKYAAPSDTVGSKKKRVEYETAFPLELLKDQKAEIAKREAGAKQWSEQSASIVDSVFSTEKASAQREKLEVGARSAQYTYAIPTSFKVQNMQNYAESLDQAFSVTGCTLKTEAGKIIVVVPLPKAHAQPIDVRTMFEKTFF